MPKTSEYPSVNLSSCLLFVFFLATPTFAATSRSSPNLRVLWLNVWRRNALIPAISSSIRLSRHTRVALSVSYSENSWFTTWLRATRSISSNMRDRLRQRHPENTIICIVAGVGGIFEDCPGYWNLLSDNFLLPWTNPWDGLNLFCFFAEFIFGNFRNFGHPVEKITMFWISFTTEFHTRFHPGFDCSLIVTLSDLWYSILHGIRRSLDLDSKILKHIRWNELQKSQVINRFRKSKRLSLVMGMLQYRYPTKISRSEGNFQNFLS